MSEDAGGKLERTLRDLAKAGTLVKARAYRQVWRFEHDGRGYYLKFYPRGNYRDRWRRFFRGSPAAREFFRLQWLQKAAIPAPRAVALLNGFKIDGRDGDAVILEAIEPSVTLDEYLNDQELRGRPVRDHRRLADQVIDLVYRLGKAGLGHDDLHLGNFLLHNGKVYLIDAYAVRRGGMRQADVLLLGASVSRYATTADVVRGWRKLGDREGRPPAADNAASRAVWGEAVARVTGDNRYFGRIEFDDGWRGIFFRHAKHPRRWSEASQLTVTDDDWRRAWPALRQQIEADCLPVLKRGPSGDVIAGEVTLAGDRPVDVVIKRPSRRYWYRYLNEIGRGARPRRAWVKAWHLIARNLPTAWPLAVFERRRFGYVTDSFVVTERLHGPTLWTIKLDALEPDARDMLFRRAGRLLRQLERCGFSHFDAKASNWIVYDDPAAGPSPALIDVDGVRRRRWVGLGIERLLRSLRDKRQYTPEDSLSLCRGYAPYARLVNEEDEEDEAPVDEAGERPAAGKDGTA